MHNQKVSITSLQMVKNADYHHKTHFGAPLPRKPVCRMLADIQGPSPQEHSGVGGLGAGSQQILKGLVQRTTWGGAQTQEASAYLHSRSRADLLKT